MSGVKVMRLKIRVRESGLGLLGWKVAAAAATLEIHLGWVGEPNIIKFLRWMPRDGLHKLILESS